MAESVELALVMRLKLRQDQGLRNMTESEVTLGIRGWLRTRRRLAASVLIRWQPIGKGHLILIKSMLIPFYNHDHGHTLIPNVTTDSIMSRRMSNTVNKMATHFQVANAIIPSGIRMFTMTDGRPWGS